MKCFDIDKFLEDNSIPNAYQYGDTILRMNLLEESDAVFPQLDIDQLRNALNNPRPNSKEKMLQDIFRVVKTGDVSNLDQLLSKPPLTSSIYRNNNYAGTGEVSISEFRLEGDGIKEVRLYSNEVEEVAKRTIENNITNPHSVEIIPDPEDSNISIVKFTPITSESPNPEGSYPFDNFTPARMEFMESFLSVSGIPITNVIENTKVQDHDSLQKYMEGKEITGEKGAEVLAITERGYSVISSNIVNTQQGEIAVLHEAAHIALDKKVEEDQEFTDNMLSLVRESMSQLKKVFNVTEPRNNAQGKLFELHSRFEEEGRSLNSIAKEFIAYSLSDQEFQSLLNTIPASNQLPAKSSKGVTSLWQRFVDTIANFFGIKADQKSMLYKTLKGIEGVYQEAPNEHYFDTDEDVDEVSTFAVDDDSPRFVRTAYSFQEVSELAAQVLAEYEFFAKDVGYKRARGIIDAALNEDSKLDKGAEVGEDGEVKDNKRNYFNAAYYPQLKREDNEKNFDSIIGRLQSGDLIRIKLKDKNGEYLTNDEGQVITKWFPALYVSWRKDKVQFAKDYGKYNSDSVAIEDIVGYRELAGDSQDKLSPEYYEDIAEKYNIYRYPSARSKQREGTTKDGKYFISGKYPNPSMWKSLTVEENKGYLEFLGEGDQIRVRRFYTDENGERKQGYIWMPVARVLAGGIEAVTKNGKSIVIAFEQIEKMAFNRKRIANESAKRAADANNALRNYGDVKRGLAENELFYTISTNSEGIQREFQDDTPDEEKIRKMRERRDKRIKSLSRGDMALVRFKFRNDAGKVTKTVRKWVPVVAVGDKALFAAWKTTDVKSDDITEKDLKMMSFGFNDVMYIAYNQQKTYDAMKAFEEASEDYTQYEGTNKSPTSSYYIKQPNDDNRKKVYNDLKPGDVVKVAGNDGYTQYAPVVKIEKGKVYLGYYRGEEREFMRDFGGVEKKVRLKKGYYTKFLYPEDIIQVGYRYNAVPNIEGSGHPNLVQRLLNNNKTFWEEAKSKAVKTKPEKDAKSFNKKFPNSVYKYIKDKATGEWVWSFNKGKAKGKPVTGLARFYKYRSTEGLVGTEAEYMRNKLGTHLEEGDYLTIKFSTTTKKDGLIYRVLSVGENYIYFTNKENEVFEIPKKRIVFNSDELTKGMVQVLNFGIRRKYNRNDTKWMYGKSSEVSTMTGYVYPERSKPIPSEIGRKGISLLNKAGIDADFDNEINFEENEFSTDPNNTFVDSGIPSLLLSKALGTDFNTAHQYLSIRYNGVAEGDIEAQYLENEAQIEEALEDISKLVSKTKGFNRVTPDRLNLPMSRLLKENKIENRPITASILRNRSKC